MSNTPRDSPIYKIPDGATFNAKTGEVTPLWRYGTREEFIAVMRPILSAARDQLSNKQKEPCRDGHPQQGKRKISNAIIAELRRDSK